MEKSRVLIFTPTELIALKWVIKNYFLDNPESKGAVVDALKSIDDKVTESLHGRLSIPR